MWSAVDVINCSCHTSRLSCLPLSVFTLCLCLVCVCVCYLGSWGSRRSRVHSCHTWVPPRWADTHTVRSPGHSWCSGSLLQSTDRLQQTQYTLWLLIIYGSIYIYIDLQVFLLFCPWEDSKYTGEITSWERLDYQKLSSETPIMFSMTYVCSLGNRSNQEHTGHMTLRCNWAGSGSDLTRCSWCPMRCEDHRRTLRKHRGANLKYFPSLYRKIYIFGASLEPDV